MSDITKKRKRFALLQLMIKCYISIAITVFTYSWLIKLKFIENGVYYVVDKLEWTSYGTWFWLVVGLLAGILWHIFYEYRIARKGKENRSTTAID